MHPTGNPKLAEWLVTQGLITPEQRERVISQQQVLGGRIEEAVLETGALGEADLLKFLANTYRTRFVTTEKLAKAQIDRATLDKVPKKVAEQFTAFPVMYDGQTSTLSVVVADPDDTSRFLQIRGDAELVTAGAIDHLDALTRAYTTHPAYYGHVAPLAQRDRETRVIGRIHAHRITLDAIHR